MGEREKEGKREGIRRERERNTFNKQLKERPSEVRFIFGLASHSEEAWVGEKGRVCVSESRGEGEHIMSLTICGEQLLARTHQKEVPALLSLLQPEHVPRLDADTKAEFS